MFAKDFMDTRFHTLRPQQSIAEAVAEFRRASESENKKIFGMMVTDVHVCGGRPVIVLFPGRPAGCGLKTGKRSHASGQDSITGVLALSDSARFRSGSCRSCTAGRMLT